MTKRPQVEADIAETEAADAASVDQNAVPGSDAVEPDEPAGDEVPGTSVDAMPDAEVTDPVAELTRERDEYLDLAQRTRAEFENFRKRSARESTEAERRGRAHVARSLVPAVDNLERALQAAGVDLDPASGTESRTLSIAARSRHTRRSPPALRWSMARSSARFARPASSRSTRPARSSTPTATRRSRHDPLQNGEEPGIVAETLQRGYSLGEVLIRPARVVVTS